MNYFALSIVGATMMLALTMNSVAQTPSRNGSKAIASALQPFVDNHSLSGVVGVVANTEKVLALECVGFSDIKENKKLSPNSLFWIASQSKPITATALMLLVDDGSVHLDDPVEKYLPEFHGQKLRDPADPSHSNLISPDHPITVRQILSHVSGLPFSTSIETPTLDANPLKTAVESYAHAPLEYAPDSKYQYSNAGINTVGRIIEVVSGQPYEQFLQKRLFDPLKMVDTTFWPNQSQLDRLAQSYKPDESKTNLVPTTVTQLHYPLSDKGRNPMPAGGLFSTATDLAHYCQMILNGGEYNGKRIVSEQSVYQMTHKQTPEKIKESYGLGWSVSGWTFGHGGAYSTNMSINTNTGLITIFMVQQAGFANDGANAMGVFQKTADKEFGPDSRYRPKP